MDTPAGPSRPAADPQGGSTGRPRSRIRRSGRWARRTNTCDTSAIEPTSARVKSTAAAIHPNVELGVHSTHFTVRTTTPTTDPPATISPATVSVPLQIKAPNQPGPPRQTRRNPHAAAPLPINADIIFPIGAGGPPVFSRTTHSAAPSRPTSQHVARPLAHLSRRSKCRRAISSSCSTAAYCPHAGQRTGLPATPRRLQSHAGQ